MFLAALLCLMVIQSADAAYNFDNPKFSSKKKDTKTTATKTETKKLNLISYSYPHVERGEKYGFTVRVYDANLNPKSNFNQNWGYLSDVNVTVQIKDDQKKIVKSFNGMTQKFGYYYDSFRIPDNFKAKYTILINATKIGYQSDYDKFDLFITDPSPRDSQ